MSDTRRDWARLEAPGFRVGLSYPPVAPSGNVVDRIDEHVEGHAVAGDFERIHLTSRDSNELYVELVRFPDRSPHDEYDEHRPSLERRFGADTVTDLAETELLGRIAWTYSFRWDEGERIVVLLALSADTYRVIYDPRSSLNEGVLRTLTVQE